MPCNEWYIFGNSCKLFESRDFIKTVFNQLAKVKNRTILYSSFVAAKFFELKRNNLLMRLQWHNQKRFPSVCYVCIEERISSIVVFRKFYYIKKNRFNLNVVLSMHNNKNSTVAHYIVNIIFAYFCLLCKRLRRINLNHQATGAQSVNFPIRL